MSTFAFPAKEAEHIAKLCHRAWKRGLFAGFNGNVSMRIDKHCLITCSGVSKGQLEPCDFAVLNIESTKLVYGSCPSSEASMHLAIFAEQPLAEAIMHCHPPHMLALGLAMPNITMRKRLLMPVFEAEQLSAKLGQAPAHTPGSTDLAHAVADEAKRNEAVWMDKHGLAVWATNLEKAIALSEELDHLAKIRLLSFCNPS